MRKRRIRAGLGLGMLAAVIALAACDAGEPSDESQPPPASGPVTPAEPSPPIEPAPPTGSPSGQPAGGQCHVGTFRITAIKSRQGVPSPVGEITVVSTGSGFRLAIAANGGWRLTAGRGQPLTLAAGGITAQGTAEGEVRGRYVRNGDKLGFRQESATGRVTVRYAGESRTVPMDDFAAALAPDGVTAITCGSPDVRLSSETVDLTLRRIG